MPPRDHPGAISPAEIFPAGREPNTLIKTFSVLSAAASVAADVRQEGK
jgi:hypothetical protein